MFCVEDTHINRALVTTFLRRIQELERIGFEEIVLAENPQTRFINAFEHFWSNYRTVREEDAKYF